jgi:hypothetical protein
MPTTKTNAEKQSARSAELTWDAQMQADHAARRAQQHADINAFQATAAAYHERGVLPSHVQPVKSLDAIYGEARAVEVAERDRLEAERRAAISPRDKLIAVLPAHKKAAIAKYKAVNGEDCPLELISYL